jgi:dTDP-4-amino-4,6-dideoxygalactose transaminase
MPSYTFPSTATAVLAQGATPTFAEVVPETMTLDPDDLARRITPKTRAIVVVQYAGATGEFGRIEEIAESAGLPVIEDAAQAFGARWDGKALGTLGCSGIYSFHQTKSITSGEGGAFLCHDPELAERARIAREKGTNRGAFERGEVDCYSWVGPGGSHLMSEISAAILEVQLDRAPKLKALRRERWEEYRAGLSSWEARGLIRLPQVASQCDPNWETFFVLLPNSQVRNECIEWMRDHQITTAFHHVPLHSSPMGQKLGCADLPVTEMLASRLLRLPLYPELRAEDGARVQDTLDRFLRAL